MTTRPTQKAVAAKAAAARHNFHRPAYPARHPVSGAGLGLRRPLLDALIAHPAPQVAFLEIAPENWMRVGGRLGRKLRALSERFPITAHGLSLSLGGPTPLDEPFVRDLKTFLDTNDIRAYSEHLSYCTDGGHLYDLMPIPFTADAVRWVADRIRRVQDILERPVAIENVSYYAATGTELDEIQFINAVLEEADCQLLLDVNNIVVNAVNHGYDPVAFLRALPAERVSYAHVAGHHVEPDDLRIDTHASAVPEAVWTLLDAAYEHCGVLPTLLERDFALPPLEELLGEVDTIVARQRRALNRWGLLPARQRQPA